LKTKYFIEKLKGSLKNLPGTDVQWIMASSDRLMKDFPLNPGPDAREAGVLILLYPSGKAVRTVFIQRPEYPGIHGGQISFPGGKKEHHDKTIIDTALRESQEEAGIIPVEIQIIGTLTPLFIPVSNTIVTGVAGWTDQRPEFIPDSREVDFLIEADLAPFLDTSMIRSKSMLLNGQTVTIRYFDYNGFVIWGATAMILNELLEIIKRDNISIP
jgi:8-oxo-dGTP pyrophosphatase MutT (NUDIX family)